MRAGIFTASNKCGERGRFLDSRERLTAAARGGETDRLPWFAWQPATDATAALDHYRKWQPDALVVQSSQEVAELLAETSAAVLVEIDNPFGRAMQRGIDLNAEFDKGPSVGDAAFGGFVQETRLALASAIESGADGVLYRVFGAEPSLSTPMQFGGFYLEQERELLGEITDARFNVVFVEGGEETYLDVVSDLPGNAFGWDEERNAVSASTVRAMHQGALACGLHSEDPQKLFASIGRLGLILSGKVVSLADRDFGDVLAAAQSLAEASR